MRMGTGASRRLSGRRCRRAGPAHARSRSRIRARLCARAAVARVQIREDEAAVSEEYRERAKLLACLRGGAGLRRRPRSGGRFALLGRRRRQAAGPSRPRAAPKAVDDIVLGKDGIRAYDHIVSHVAGRADVGGARRQNGVGAVRKPVPPRVPYLVVARLSDTVSLHAPGSRVRGVLGGGGEVPSVEIRSTCARRSAGRGTKVKATVNGVELRTTVAVYGGKSYVGFRADIRKSAGIVIGDRIRVRLEPDQEVRVVEVPDELMRALTKDKAAKKAFEALAFTHRKEYATWVAGAKKPETARAASRRRWKAAVAARTLTAGGRQ